MRRRINSYAVDQRIITRPRRRRNRYAVNPRVITRKWIIFALVGWVVVIILLLKG